MNKVNFPFYKFSSEELKELKGKFMQSWTDETYYEHWSQKPRIVKDYSGRFWDLEKCLEIAGQQLEVGNKKQIQALKALDFFNYIYNLNK